jgi:two-component system, cell cycle response regulator DivK
MKDVPVVLLVEDNADNREIYSIILRNTGYTVLEAVDGEAALEMTRMHLPALILMDISIPKIDGYSVTRILKADSSTGMIPIVALTAHALPGEEDRAREAGCDGYMSKPVAPKRVLEEVQKFIGPPTIG